jgi:hypothetical protein
VVVVFALLAALANAVNEAPQHVAGTAALRRSAGWRLVLMKADLHRNGHGP